jgi:hypothetical protein
MVIFLPLVISMRTKVDGAIKTNSVIDAPANNPSLTDPSKTS